MCYNNLCGVLNNPEPSTHIKCTKTILSYCLTPTTMAAEILQNSTTRRRKKPSQKGKSRFKLPVPWWKVRTPNPPLTARKAASVCKVGRKKTTETTGDDGAIKNPVRRRLDLEEEEAGDGGVGGNPLLVRRRLDMDDDAKVVVGSGTPLDGFSKATLMDNLRSLAKLTLGGGDDVNMPPRRTPKIDLPSYSRAQLMENLRSLAVVDETSMANGQGTTTKGTKKKKKAAMQMQSRRVPKLVLKPYKSKRQAAATATDEDEEDATIGSCIT